MTQIQKNTLEFLQSLDKNNRRDWFQKHKDEYQVAKDNIEAFIGDLIRGISAFDKSVQHVEPAECMFRIYRDVRFSKIKTPYKPYFRLGIMKGGKSNCQQAGYYMHIEPGGKTRIVGGVHKVEPKWLGRIRSNIADHTDEFEKILKAKKFRDLFGTMEGEQLKSAPKGFAKDHPAIDLLRYKDFMAVHKVADKQVLDPDFAKYAVSVFKSLYDFNQFLNK